MRGTTKHLNMRAAAISATAVLLALITGAARSQDVAAASFCQRLAGQLGMAAKPVEGRPGWEVNTLKGLGPKLFGGSSIMSMGVEAVGEPTIEDYRRMNDACEPLDKGAVCKVEGPMSFHVGAKGRIVEITATAGERAQVRIQGTRIRCEDGAS